MWKDILIRQDTDMIVLPGSVEDPWVIRILLHLEHSLNNQLTVPADRTLE